MRDRKRLSISSFDRSPRGAVVAFLVTMALLVFTGERLRWPLSAFTVMWDRVRSVPVSADDAWYVAYDDFSIDHYVLYHGIGEPIRRAREADVLLVGNSRAQFAFPQSELERGTLESGVRFYNLAFAHAEKSVFVNELIERNDLTPRVVVANADLFFQAEPTPFGRQKTVFERTLAGRVRTGVVEVLPRWELPSPTRDRRWPTVVYRSATYGSWYAVRERFLFRHLPADVVSSDFENTTDSLVHARAFQRRLAARGIQLVLTSVPGAALPRAHVVELGEALGVPVIAPSLPGMIERDARHLTDVSGQRFARRFLDDFIEWAVAEGITSRRRSAI